MLEKWRIRISLSKEEVHDLFDKAEKFRKRTVDNVMVLMDFKLAYYCALKTGEVLLLKIRDVFDESGEVRSHIHFKDRQILVPEILKPELKAYCDHLRREGHPAGKSAYLFPITKTRTGGGKVNTFAARVRKWHRGIKEVSDIYNVHEKIRQAGIREYFSQLPQDISEEKRIKKAAEFAGCSVEWAEIVLRKGAPRFLPRPTKRERRGY